MLAAYAVAVLKREDGCFVQGAVDHLDQVLPWVDLAQGVCRHPS
jgi:hypothetical protein